MQVDGLGIGYSSVSLSDGKVFTMGADGEESVFALDAVSGAVVWQTPRRPGATGWHGRGAARHADD